MKTKLFILLTLVATIMSCEEKEDPIPELPPDIIRTKADSTLFNKIESLFPTKYKADSLYPALFSDTVQKMIVLTSESEVYLKFIAEKAVYKNTVGWYSYTQGSEPKSVKEVNIHLLFPNVSSVGEGGELMQGDMLQLGDQKFPKGTVIGFFLIVRGWQNGSIDYNRETVYTDSHLNPGGSQQHMLFKEKTNGDLCLGFEDIVTVLTDKDYNDILFSVTDNKDGFKTIAFDESKIPTL